MSMAAIPYEEKQDLSKMAVIAAESRRK